MIPWELVDSDGAKARFRLGDGAADGGSSVQVNTRKGSTEMLVCQIVYYMVSDSNGFDTVSGRKEGGSAQMWEVNSRQLKVEGKRLGLVILLARTNAHRFKSLFHRLEKKDSSEEGL